MRWPSAWLAGCSCAALLAGCGGHEAAPPPKPPRIPPAVAQQLAADADGVAGLSGCSAHDAAAKLQSDTINAWPDGKTMFVAGNVELAGKWTKE